MDGPVVVGVDDAPGMPYAVDWAAAEAVRTGRPLRLVHAAMWRRDGREEPPAPGAPEPPGAAGDPSAERLLRDAGDRARRAAPGVPVSAEAVVGEPEDALVRESETAALLVTAPHDHGPLVSLLLGSVSPGVAERSSCPVALVRAPLPTAGPDGPPVGGQAVAGSAASGQAVAGSAVPGPVAPGPVVLGVGGRSGGDAAGRYAHEQARARGCSLLAVRAWRAPPPDVTYDAATSGDWTLAFQSRAEDRVDEAVARAAADHPEVPVRRVTAEGSAHQVLVDAARGAQLLVVGVPRRRGTVSIQLGRVTPALLHDVPCPVVFVPPSR
ncbi:universal stress protein [Streptomyces otsuchiensis]|uniref:universal stress protein n=1 Tax=Streptomyces otsuchiensis TaxID=2681388 RepID=UPI001D131701|nr:universal stress protein [Streptomyces otsuchiensis]